MPLDQPGLTIVGLGPGPWESLTLEAAHILEHAAEVHVPISRHQCVQSLRAHLPDLIIHGFDAPDKSADECGRIAETLSARVEQSGAAVYAVPGTPSLGNPCVRAVCARLEALGMPVRLVHGLSEVDSSLSAVGNTNPPWLVVLDAADLGRLGRANALGEVPDDTALRAWRAPVPTAATLVPHLHDRATATAVRHWLCTYYPENQQVYLIGGADAHADRVRQLALHEVDADEALDDTTSLYVPSLSETDNVRTFAGLMQLTRTLRAPGGCPWDREQSHSTLKPHLLEEAYEVLDALDSGDPRLIAEELGDLLFQVTIHSQIAAEAGTFTIEDVIEGIMRKLIGRHPHVFGDLELSSAQDVRHAWESFKQREKPKRASVLEEIPRGLPALPRSNLMQKRAAGLGFEWPGIDEVLAKVDEELTELRAEISNGGAKELQRAEFGDILFALVSVARHLRIDPEEALRLANHKFERRFRHVEARATADGAALRELSPVVLDGYWNEAKSALPEA